MQNLLQKLYQLMLRNRKTTGNMRVPGINPYLIAAVLWLAPLPVSAQGMLDMVDMTTPEMAEAEMSREQLEALLADASRDRPVDLTKRRFSGLDLSGIDFKGADLRWSRFNYADLEGADLSDTRLDLTWFYKADLDGADLSRSHLFSAQLQHASLENADIRDARVVANFQNANLAGASFRDSDLAADMKNQSMGLMTTVFTSANLSGADLSRVKASRVNAEFADFSAASLTGADFSDAKLGGARFSGADVGGLRLTGADLDSADLTGLVNADGIVGLNDAVNRTRARFD